MIDGQFHKKRIVLGVTGSIAAYKAVSLLRTLTEEGAEVSVVMTQAATQFVAPLTFEVLSKQAVSQNLFSDLGTMPHLSLTESADLVLLAPATANTIAKCALGLADDLLSTLVLAARCPIIIVPAMDGDMWNHPAVIDHTRLLRNRGLTVLDPEDGVLASGLIGKGRLPAEESILEAITVTLGSQHDMSGQRILISAGPTREPIDAVRFITNGSSGKMGYAIAERAVQRGAEVVLVSGPTALMPPAKADYIPVVTADEMYRALAQRFSWSTVLIMSAAVGDFRPRQPALGKVKKRHWKEEVLELDRTLDILATLSRDRTHQILVGFAAETNDLIENGRRKLQEKNLDLVAINNIAGPHSAFGNESNKVIFISSKGEITHLERMPKRALADRLLDEIKTLLAPCAQSGKQSRVLRGL